MNPYSKAIPAKSPWEEAYARFETPEAEIAKFIRRLRSFGVERWNRESRIVELFCGRGNGLHAWTRLGFRHVTGVDLSPALLNEYQGEATCVVADCRELPLESHAVDVVIVQGGLHHLIDLPTDLEAVLCEMRRLLAPQGCVVIVEPWLTPFLAFVHLCCRRRRLRCVWPKLAALATMIEHEQATYENWLSRPDQILNLLHSHFAPLKSNVAWGKLSFLGASPTRGE
ncbi:MAG: class I SAM-dependent methyltransferase [Planctomycetales bacterium]|nr:class I SAM-dependent methyltransferase [Planctomycetales bacterium]